MSQITNPNPNGPQTTEYDAAGHQVVAAESGAVETDATTGEYYAPEVTEPEDVAASRLGQAFQASVSFATTTITSGLSVLHLLNNSSTKTAIIRAIWVWYNTAGVHPIVQISQTTGADANATHATTISKKNPGGAASLMTVTDDTTASAGAGPSSLAGTVCDTRDLSANNQQQLISVPFALPAGAVNGLEIGINAPNGESGITIEWEEF